VILTERAENRPHSGSQVMWRFYD